MISGNVSPWLVRAVITGHDAENDGLIVMMATGQMLGYPVKRLHHYADALRLHKTPLPSRGTWGLLAFPNGDIKNGIWLGSYYPNLMDALPSTAGDPFSEYSSHFSGHWSYMDGLSGYISTQLADGSSFIVGSGAGLQTVYRHVIDQNQKRQQIPFTFSDRNPNPQSPFAYTFSQSGTNFLLSLSPSGSPTLTFNSSQTLTIQQSGSTTSIVIAPNGNVTITSPTVTVSGILHVTGEVIANYGGADSVTVSQHIHDGVQTGSGNTAKPTAGT